MAEFSFNDSVEDLLSDDSDDSFFDDPKLPSKQTNFKGKTSEKKNVADVFGLSENTEVSKPIKNVAESIEINENQKSDGDWLGLIDSAKTPTSQPTQEFKKITKNVSFEDDDILATLGLNKKSEVKSKADVNLEGSTTNKGDLFSDILGTSITVTTQRKLDLDKILGETSHEKQADNLVPKPVSSELQSITSDLMLPMSAESRRPRIPRSNLVDPLGLFSKEIKPAGEDRSIKLAKNLEEDQMTESSRTTDKAVKVMFPSTAKDMQTKSAPSIPDLPDWLGGTSVKQHKSEPDIHTIARTTSSRKNSLQQETNEATEPVANTVDNLVTKVSIANNPLLDPLLTQQRISAAHLGYQNTSLAMHQQESQLLMSLQLKKYEEKLTEMQKQQQDILTKQEQQFNSLIESQFAKQQIMENNLRLQQERINNHIQLLISQPSIASHAKEREGEVETENESHEKYEDVINSLKQRQSEEMFLLEESYK